MPELVAIKTTHFECVIWAKDISASRQRLATTMSVRRKELPVSTICFRPEVKLLNAKETIIEYDCGEPLFFENKQYDIEFIFDASLKQSFHQNPPQVIHRLKNVEDAFHYSARSHSLRATINTANDIGWFRVELKYWINRHYQSQSIAFEVLPVKIDMASDLNHMNALIDSQYPLWRFSLAEKTQQQLAAVKRPHSQFLLLWLSQFEGLQKDFTKGLKHIVNAPHSRLINVKKSVKADRLKGKLSPKLESSVKQAQDDGRVNRRFSVHKKQLSLDTPENRFIKAVVKNSIKKLVTISGLIKQNQLAPEAQRISNSFILQLESWKTSLCYFENHIMFRDVGDFKGFSRESLVLQQKPGYAKVYRVWQELKLYLDLLGSDSSLSLKNIAELYEIWCFLKIRNILLELGFSEVINKRAQLKNNGLEITMNDGLAGAFCFERDDGITLKLAHEREFRSNTKPIKTWTTPQKPDILLEVTFTDGSEFIWLFDAKYRIKQDEVQDLVPDDAINQLHRYRDALIHLHQPTIDTTDKTRPVFGAYALYPGFYNQSIDDNPYQEAIDETGIGAFSLLPDDDSGSNWLKSFLQKKLGVEQSNYTVAESDKYYVEEAARISYKGTTVSHYTDLTIAVNGIVSGRSKEYRQKLETGSAEYYHMKLLASERQDIEQHIIREARYLAVAVSESPALQKISYLYPISSVEKRKRGELTAEQTGSNKIKDPDEIYWLFTLGESLTLKTPLSKSFSRRFEVKLTNASAFSCVNSWADLPLRYQLLNNFN